MTSLLLHAKDLLLSPLLRMLHVSGACSGLLMLRGFERVRWNVGRLGAWVQYRAAIRHVPAYRSFMQHSTAPSRNVSTIDGVPEVDKSNYITPFALSARCVGGELPLGGLLIDESSGSSGEPTNWVRGVRERAANRRTIRLGMRHRFGKGPLFILNAFALGPWATGINLTLSMATWARVKTLGPDLDKIANALRQFGTEHHYLILGYPPFLKQLVDRADIEWARYNVSFAYGGEGMSESMRRYLQKKGVARVYGSYGASDLELNMAAETDLTIALRRLLEERPALAEKLLVHRGTMPMIFQFNPADFFMQSNSDGELLITICRPGYVAPKVRYNIHDRGHVIRYPDLREILASEQIDLDALDPQALDLPLLFHYGRSDASVAWYGCKIPPADVQESLFRVPALAEYVDAFQLRTFDDDEGDKRLVIAIEVPPDRVAGGAAEWSENLFDALAAVNQDFRESRRMAPDGKRPVLEVHALGAGPFEGSDIRIKRTYVARSAA